ncbi:hypothetical protein [Burkholderia sp. AU38729]|uniref:hypothetical protein n=2 Tax=Burkholderia TaxID=32008 RepID=UPI0039A5C2D4
MEGSAPHRQERRRSIRREEGETVRYMVKVFVMLLDFATLPEKSRKDFLGRMNEFMIMSPQQKRRAITEWKQVLEERGESDEGTHR